MKALSVENVSKKFVLAHSRPRNLADALRHIVSRQEREDFWALQDVSFDVAQGEAVGIIGHNGAGKSTVLKLLTKIMEPTSGKIRTRGRVSALIEVGAGFHPEMTGRENIYLNGSILGMSKREIDQKFDEIVAFAELDKFIDTPVKRYSSGMYARLGFAVAAHVDPEVLIIDEVLSVGDIAFQEKCTQKMLDLCTRDTTVLFVSHNMGAVIGLCDRAILLDRGQLKCMGAPADVVSFHRSLSARSSENTDRRISRSSSSSPLFIEDIEAIGDTDFTRVESGRPFAMRIHYAAKGFVAKPRIGVRFRNTLGTVIGRINVGDIGKSIDIDGPGYLDLRTEELPLLPDVYIVEAYVVDALGVLEYEDAICSCELVVVSPSTVQAELKPGAQFGYVWMNVNWEWSAQK